MTTAINNNVALQEGFTQVCVWPATTVGETERDEFVKWLAKEFGVRGQYLEEIVTLKDKTGPGGRNDLFFAIHSEDVGKFAVPRLACGIRWIEDVFANHQGHLYPDRVAEYKSWDAGSVDDPDEDDCE